VKIGVCLKQVPASDTRIKVNADGSGIVTDEVKWEVNPYDEFALEAALLLKEAGKASEVVILTLGGADSEQRIKDGLARGADSAVRLDDPCFAGSDSLGVARVLAAATQKAEIGLVLCGKQAIDGDSSQVPAMIAEFLDWPQITDINSLELDGTTVRAHRAAGAGNKDVIEATLPVVLSCDKGLNTPRFASLRGIMMAKRKKIEVWGAADLGVDTSQVGAGAAMLVEQGLNLPPARPSGRMIEGGSVGDKVNELVRLLREEAKVL
jgi:electron transfer flavoprotein beta subunit